MSEFSLKEGRMGKGIVGAVLAAVKYLVIPLLIIYIIVSLTSGIGEEFPVGESLETVRNSAILMGIPIVVLAFLTGFYPKGSYSRMLFGIIMVAAICVWIWLVTMGGDLSISIDRVGVNLDFSALVLLFILAASLKAVYYLAEAPSYRNEWLQKRGDEKGETQPPSEEGETVGSEEVSEAQDEGGPSEPGDESTDRRVDEEAGERSD